MKNRNLKKSTSASWDELTPEYFNNYLRINNPRSWMLLAASLIVLVGAMIWNVFGILETKDTTVGTAENGQMTVYAKSTDRNLLEGAIVRVENAELVILPEMIAAEPVKVDNNFSDWVIEVGRLVRGEWVYPITFDTDIENGVYEAYIVTESRSPLSRMSEME